MDSVPPWVPPHAIKCQQGIDSTEPGKQWQGIIVWSEEDAALIERLISSPNMEKAWLAIAKRADEQRLTRCLGSILFVNHLLNTFDDYPKSGDVSAFRDLAERTRKYLKKVRTIAGKKIESDWKDSRSGMQLNSYFKILPLAAIEELATYFEETAQDFAEARTEITAYAGNPESKNAKRAFVIRHCSEQISEIFGQPLHSTVASIASELLQTPIDTQDVRTLVRSKEALDPPYWAG